MATGAVDESKNNGQIGRIESSIGGAKQWQQHFSYDSLARLSSASEVRGDNAQPVWAVNYDFDVYANRYQKQARNPGNPFTQYWTEDADINQATNRYANGLTYDNTGNVTVDSKFRNLAFQYDANNRQKQSSAPDGSGAVVSVYDAGGQRVATQVSGSLTNVLVYDAGGKLVAEYGSAPAEPNGTQYVTGDHQGSPRAITNSSGAVVSRHDYAPFGENLPSGVGMRTPGQNYSQPDSVRQKYAGMENDDGTGMSHTLWRKYDPLSARWTVPDPYGGSMEIDDPQTFNRYSYVGNDPVNETDPLGLMAGADQSWGSVAGDFWGSSAGFNKPNFGGPEVIGTALFNHDTAIKRRQLELRQQKGFANDEGDDVIVTYTTAFNSRAEAIAYYEAQFGGPVSERHRRFYLASWLRVRDAQNRVAGWIHSTSPIGNYVTGTPESIFGAPAADTASEEYAQRETAAAVAAFFTPGPGGKIKGLKLAFGHGARHLAGSGLSQRVVERAIRSHAKQTLRSASESGSFWGRVVVGGRTVEYRAHTLADGTINIGTYYLK